MKVMSQRLLFKRISTRPWIRQRIVELKDLRAREISWEMIFNKVTKS